MLRRNAAGSCMPWDYIETVIPSEKSNFVFRVIKPLKLVICCENFLQTRISNMANHVSHNMSRGVTLYLIKHVALYNCSS